MDLNDQAVVVTGAASGLGAATARALARAGARVALLDKNREGASALAAEIGGLAVYCDITDPTGAEQALAEASAAHGPARVLVNCAGGGTGRRTVGRDGPMPLEEFSRWVTLNLVGTFNMIRLAAAEMIKQPELADGERGVIIATSSIAAYDGQLGQAAYSAAKGGIVAMTLPLAREFAQFGVRVMTIAPGIFRTPMLEGGTAEKRAGLAATIPFPHRFGEAEEFAGLVGHIVANRYLNGEVIRLDAASRLSPR